MVKVVTHAGGLCVELCPTHGQLEIIQKYVGPLYLGVKAGLHEGTCLECTRLMAEHFNDQVLGEGLDAGRDQ